MSRIQMCPHVGCENWVGEWWVSAAEDESCYFHPGDYAPYCSEECKVLDALDVRYDLMFALKTLVVLGQAYEARKLAIACVRFSRQWDLYAEVLSEAIR